MIWSLNYIFWFIGFKKSVVFSSTITEEDEEEDSDVFADEPNDVDPEELEMAFDNFLDKLEGLVSKRRQNGSLRRKFRDLPRKLVDVWAKWNLQAYSPESKT